MREKIKRLIKIVACVLMIYLMLFFAYLGYLHAWTWGY